MSAPKASFLARTLALATVAVAVVALLSVGCGGRKAKGVGGGGVVSGAYGDGGGKVADGDGVDTGVGGGVDGPHFIDPRDSRMYRTVRLGKHEWFAENLSYKVRQSWCYGGDESNCERYGRLYDWASAKTSCPSGWRLPTIEDWGALMEAVGGVVEVYDGGGDMERYAGAGGKLKSKTGWSDNGNGTDDYGFSALPGGYRRGGGGFGVAGKGGGWWSATDNGGSSAVGMGMGHVDGHAYESDYDKRDGFSVRCIK